MTGLCYGGDYNPEQWPEDTWVEDVALMRAAGVNLVTVGVFSWAEIEPEPCRYDFDRLDRVMDLLHGGGIRVALATPTASPPPWLGLAHPDVLTVDGNGVRLSHGSRDTYCLSAPAYRTAAIAVTGELARRYGDHPALAMWHIHNEYGTWCHCEHVAAAFRTWLRDRHGDLAELNRAWTTAFWGQRYGSWEQIQPPRATQYLPNPSQALDFRRFLSDEFRQRYREQRDVLAAAAPEVPATTNLAFGNWVPVDPWRWADDLDLVAIDSYPSAEGIGAAEQTAFVADLTRSWAGGRPWLLMEQAAGHLHVDGRMLARPAGQLARHSLSHVARGSRGAMFFQWRASRGGAERFHSAMVPHAGPDSRVFREVTELGAALGRLSEVDAGTVDAAAAILWDSEAWWALSGAGMPSTELDYLERLRSAHRVLWRAGLTVDFAHPAADLSAYPLVLVPSLYLVSDAAAESIARYVAGGGHLVVWCFSGIADADAQIRLGGYPGAFREVLGVRVEEFQPLTAPVGLSTGGSGRIWSEDVQLAGATAVTTYKGGALDGRPAMTRHGYGDGVAWYLSTILDDADLAPVLASVAREAGLRPVPTDGVELVTRRAGEVEWLFALNHADAPREVPATGVDLMSGDPVNGVVSLPPGGVAVIRLASHS